MKKYTIYILALLGAQAFAQNQELSGSLSAVGDYKAEVRTHNRQTGLPARMELVLPQGELQVDADSKQVTVVDELQNMEISVPQLSAPSWRGYAALQMGSWLNTSLSAGYRFVQTPSATLGAWLQHSSSTLYRAEEQSPYRRIYDETVSVYGSKRFDRYGTLQARATYRLGYFNYYNVADNTPTQTLNDFSVSAKWLGRRAGEAFFLDGGIDYRYYGYRRFYIPGIEGLQALKPSRENDLDIFLTAGYNYTSNSALSLTYEGRVLMYSKADNALIDFMPESKIKDYRLFSLTPAYDLNSEHWSLHAGAKIDISADIDKVVDFSKFHIAPDVAVSYTNGKAMVWAKAGGGVTPLTLSYRGYLDMYQTPSLMSILPQYSPIDATLGLRLGSFNGLSAAIYGSWAITDNSPVSGFYPYSLDKQAGAMGQTLPTESTMSIKGFSLGAEVDYKLSNFLDVQAALTYQRQHGQKGWFNGLDRPRWTLDMSAQITPIEGFDFGVTYNYRGVRRLWYTHNGTDGSLRLGDQYLLGAFARYTLNGRYTFSLNADNMLSCHSSLHPLLPNPGFTLTAGFSILF